MRKIIITAIAALLLLPTANTYAQGKKTKKEVSPIIVGKNKVREVNTTLSASSPASTPSLPTTATLTTAPSTQYLNTANRAGARSDR